MRLLNDTILLSNQDFLLNNWLLYWQLYISGKGYGSNFFRKPFPLSTVVEKGCIRKAIQKKSRIRETLNLSTDADTSTDTTVGWTKNTQKPKKNEKQKIIQNGKTQKRLEICQN